MKKWILLTLMILFIPLALAYTELEYSYDNTTWNPLEKTNNNSLVMEELGDGVNESTNYYFRLRHVYDQGNSDWTYISTKTKTSGGVNELIQAIVITLNIFGVLFIVLGLLVLLQRVK